MTAVIIGAGRIGSSVLELAADANDHSGHVIVSFAGNQYKTSEAPEARCARRWGSDLALVSAEGRVSLP